VGYCTTSPRVLAYPWSGAGFGTKYSDPASVPTSTCYDVAFNPEGTAIALALDSSPYVSVYAWSSSGFGTRYSNPASLPAGTPLGVTFNPAGTAIALAHLTTPFVTAYPWSGSGFGTKYANPSTLPTGTGRGLGFSTDGSQLAVAHDTSPFFSVYAFSISGFGAKTANPSVLATAAGTGIKYSPQGPNALFVSISGPPYILGYTSASGSKFSDPVSLPPGVGQDLAFSPNGWAVALACGTTPFLLAYKRSLNDSAGLQGGFGTQFSSPSTLPAGAGRGVIFGRTPA